MVTDYSKLQRPKYQMPEYVKKALKENHLVTAFYERPAYQQNDYIGWIKRAKRPQTAEKRLLQMLDELSVGGVYMKMKHSPSKK